MEQQLNEYKQFHKLKFSEQKLNDQYLNYLQYKYIPKQHNNNLSHVKNINNIKKINKKTIPSAVKRLVWNRYIGENIGKSKCYCCRSTDITQLSFHCGHVIAENNGGKTNVDNLRPICQNCNLSMRTINMHDFIDKYKLY